VQADTVRLQTDLVRQGRISFIAGMDPPSEFKKEKAALLVERAALRRKVRALENDNAALAARGAELEQRLL